MKQENICPLCRHAMGKEAARQIIAEIPCGRMARNLLEAMADHFGMWMSRQRLAAILYGDRLDGGPEWGLNSVSVQMTKLRPRLLKHGILIERKYAIGMRMVWTERSS